MKVLEVEPGFSGREANALSQWAISPAPDHKISSFPGRRKILHIKCTRSLLKFSNISFIKHRICMTISWVGKRGKGSHTKECWIPMWREGKSEEGEIEGRTHRVRVTDSSEKDSLTEEPINEEAEQREDQSEGLFLKSLRSQKGMGTAQPPWEKDGGACSFRTIGTASTGRDPGSEQSRGRRTSSHIHFWQGERAESREKGKWR